MGEGDVPGPKADGRSEASPTTLAWVSFFADDTPSSSGHLSELTHDDK